MADLARLYNAIVQGDARTAREVVGEALRENVDPLELMARYMVPAMDEVGRRFDAEEYFYTELFVAGRAMKAAFEPIRPLLASTRTDRLGRVLIGTVEGDLHDIGKNLVGAMLEGAGFEVIDIGVDVSPREFVRSVDQTTPDIIALSTLMTITIPAMRAVVAALEQTGLRDVVKVMVGGAAITKPLALEIGADGFGQSATAAVSLARDFLCSHTRPCDGLAPQSLIR